MHAVTSNGTTALSCTHHTHSLTSISLLFLLGGRANRRRLIAGNSIRGLGDRGRLRGRGCLGGGRRGGEGGGAEGAEWRGGLGTPGLLPAGGASHSGEEGGDGERCLG